VITVDSVDALRQQLAGWRQSGERIALVPTMGNLHAGHLQLVARAAQLADRVVVSIFVNPMQFGAGEDLAAYPRTLQRDAEELAGLSTSLLFTPAESTVYLRPKEQETRVEVCAISDILCGAARPGHFVGVATVVCKLFNMVQPHLALFGEKDFQQLLVIRRMVEDLFLPIEIVGVATVREADGLAMSSRNGYLTADERRRAPALYRVLLQLAEAIRGGNRDFVGLQQQAANTLQQQGLRADYIQIRRASDLAEPQPGDRELVILAAACLGKARLIDNVALTVD
jgi:pantoate--beta-alanine ligase